MPDKTKTESEAPMAKETSATTQPSIYVDGEIVREGPYGDQGDGAYSAGRGGAGNIGSPMARPSSRVPHDTDMIPELAVRDSTDETYHTGVSRELFWLLTIDLFYGY
ncbi:unnamed protein product [Penicillium nalgiovense]|uniref:Uncharacterized protein n=1 Tax=Penicillium nalgiovense TaxID=60175 RepID=A0A9W4HTD7_PENNA|nr:unnamed protein product [Penicillium nalgiovense]CAG8110231.1 unnamed protein product [Penicillium nalgiovense]CAG8114574.1 unnamed protein product [Penicillium nalgiovense]CAG8124742.1 unnamed protein product [Penicillium nalgiovense]CAG8137252.1 unnamed protein product [Penicillium nalgiovense]